MENVTDQTKPVLSIRIPVAAKQKLIDDAQALGMSMSEHAEQILLMGIYDQGENEQIEKLKKEIERLTQQLQEVQTRLRIFSDPRLLSIYEQVKGMSDEIITPEGTKHPTTYATPEHLLYAMIYSYSLNK